MTDYTTELSRKDFTNDDSFKKYQDLVKWAAELDKDRLKYFRQAEEYRRLMLQK